MANTFSTSQIIDEVKKVKLPSHMGFSDRDRVAKKWIKSSLEHLQAFADKHENLDWNVHYVDGTSCTRPPARRWWKKGGEEDEKLGRTREWFQYENTHSV